MLQGVKSKILHDKMYIPEESRELREQIKRFKAVEKKEELKWIIEDMGLRKGN